MARSLLTLGLSSYFGLVIIIGRNGFSHPLAFPTLQDQDNGVAEIVSHLQPEDRIFVHGSTEILVLSGLKLLNVPEAQWILLAGLIALGVGLAAYGVVAWRARPRLQTASG